jgi:hypothetical protein
VRVGFPRYRSREEPETSAEIVPETATTAELAPERSTESIWTDRSGRFALEAPEASTVRFVALPVRSTAEAPDRSSVA